MYVSIVRSWSDDDEWWQYECLENSHFLYLETMRCSLKTRALPTFYHSLTEHLSVGSDRFGPTGLVPVGSQLFSERNICQHVSDLSSGPLHSIFNPFRLAYALLY